MLSFSNLWIRGAATTFAVLGCLHVTALSAQQDAASKTANQLSFDIPAQALVKALAQFSDVTGLQLVYETKLASGKRSPAVAGVLAPPDALTRLLAGTGLEFRFTDSRTIVIRAARSESGARVLAPVRVEGAQGSAVLEAVTVARRRDPSIES